jgi:hypothetical protein
VIRKPLEFKEYVTDDEFFLVRRPITVFKDPESKTVYKMSKKLMERYCGPYKIVRQISPVLYEAEVDGVLTRVHAQNMKPG